MLGGSRKTPWLLIDPPQLHRGFVALGMFAVEALQRARGAHRSALAAHHKASGGGSDDLELWILKRLEWLRVVSRTTPMLGLVATMIPMGPALLALTNNDARSIGENLSVAFSAVIVALISASITFAIPLQY
ncbi:MotA/TolQ/ExbB proton channel family protein [Tardiphaga robiniae]|uniref:MotA/TolQ/ExbB proton channel family protein n=1 Tax=Tardiphaga robiniae TaxID=943830 RepID=UPI000AED55ED|nr:MotA/TolQ/ExbB proton channel family protein [Tardiphaga robiniae]